MQWLSGKKLIRTMQNGQAQHGHGEVVEERQVVCVQWKSVNRHLDSGSQKLLITASLCKMAGTDSQEVWAWAQSVTFQVEIACPTR